MKHLNIHIKGLVQGVWFRASTKETADRLGVKGIVKNLPDGSVYAEAEADEAVLAEFVRWCQEGPELARVKSVEQKAGDLKGYHDFRIER